MDYSPNGKGIMMPMDIPSWFIAPKEKAWFYKRFFFETVMVMVNNKRKGNKKIQCQ